MRKPLNFATQVVKAWNQTVPFQFKCLWDRSAGDREAGVGDSGLVAGVGRHERSSLTTSPSAVGLRVLVTLW